MPSFDSPPTSLDMLSAPRRRPPRSPSQSARIRVQNRRAEYLLRNPDYFNSTDHELAGTFSLFSLVGKLAGSFWLTRTRTTRPAAL